MNITINDTLYNCYPILPPSDNPLVNIMTSPIAPFVVVFSGVIILVLLMYALGMLGGKKR